MAERTLVDGDNVHAMLVSAKPIYLNALEMLATLEAKAHLFLTGRLPFVPFRTGSHEFSEDGPPVHLEELIVEVAYASEALMHVVNVNHKVCGSLAATRHSPQFNGPVSFRQIPVQSYGALVAELLWQCLQHCPAGEGEGGLYESIRRVAEKAVDEKEDFPCREDFADVLAEVYEIDWRACAESILSSLGQVSDRPEDSWNWLCNNVESEFSCAIAAVAPRTVGLGREPDGEAGVAVDLAKGVIVVLAVEYLAEPHHCRIVKALLDADGLYLTGPEMNDLPGCHGKKISREIKRLEQKIPPLKDRIIHGGSKGYRLVR